MKKLISVFILTVSVSVFAQARGLTPYSDPDLCTASQENVASDLNGYIENFKSCFALAKKKQKKSSEYKSTVQKANEFRLQIRGELGNCGYYCDDPSPCMSTVDVMLTPPNPNEPEAIPCWGDAW